MSGPSAFTFVRGRAGVSWLVLIAATLISYAAGIDPARVSKRQNLIAKVASYYQPSTPGYYGSTFNATVFGLLALADAKTTGGVQRPGLMPSILNSGVNKAGLCSVSAI